jgi:hypothetical protein
MINRDNDSDKAVMEAAALGVMAAIEPIKNPREVCELLVWIGASMAIRCAPDVAHALDAVATSVSHAVEDAGGDKVAQLAKLAAGARSKWTPENN